MNGTVRPGPSRATLASLAVLLALAACHGSAATRDKPLAAPSSAVESPLAPAMSSGRLRFDFVVTVEPALAKAYGDALSLPAADLSPEYVADCLADGFGEMPGLWNLRRTKDSIPPSSVVQARVRLSLFDLAQFNLGGRRVGGLSSDLEMSFHSAAGLRRWQAKFGAVSLSVPSADENREQWRLVLKQAGQEIFSRSGREGFVAALQADGQPLSATPALFAVLRRDTRFGLLEVDYRKKQEIVRVATLLKQPTLVADVVAQLRKYDDSGPIEGLYFEMVEYLGEMDDPAARQCLLGVLVAFQAAKVESGYYRENFLRQIAEALARQAAHDAAIESALRGKLAETTAHRYKEILSKALAGAGKGKE